MALTKEQIAETKKQLATQIGHLPREQQEEAQKQIDSLSEGALEEMINQQKSRSSQPVFRMIISGKIESVKIGENSSAIAVLDIAPISDGHVVIIPKEPAKTEKEIPKQAFELAEKILAKLKENLNAKAVEVFPESKFSEFVLNVVPIYDKPLSQNSQRTQKTIDDLKEIQKKLSVEIIKKEKKAPEIIKISRKKTPKSQIIKLSKRIP